jgi:small basic protein (TIGR04137 family)
MSIHPSLSTSEKDKKQRSVLKRSERIKTMLEKGLWKEGDKVYGLPKIKTIKIRIKKEKVEKAADATAADATAAATAETPAKAAAPAAKPSGGKAQEKK